MFLSVASFAQDVLLFIAIGVEYGQFSAHANIVGQKYWMFQASLAMVRLERDENYRLRDCHDRNLPLAFFFFFSFHSLM